MFNQPLYHARSGCFTMLKCESHAYKYIAKQNYENWAEVLGGRRVSSLIADGRHRCSQLHPSRIGESKFLSPPPPPPPPNERTAPQRPFALSLSLSLPSRFAH